MSSPSDDAHRSGRHGRGREREALESPENVLLWGAGKKAGHAPGDDLFLRPQIAEGRLRALFRHGEEAIGDGLAP